MVYPDWDVQGGLRDKTGCRVRCTAKTSAMTRRVLEGTIEEGKNPVGEVSGAWVLHPSTTGHEESCGNLGRPRSKAKYDTATDSERVP